MVRSVGFFGEKWVIFWSEVGDFLVGPVPVPPREIRQFESDNMASLSPGTLFRTCTPPPPVLRYVIGLPEVQWRRLRYADFPVCVSSCE